MSKNTGQVLVDLLNGPDIGGDVAPGSRKAEFKRVGTKYMRELAAALGCQRGAFDVRFNAGGPAVSGDIVLHTDTLYVCVTQRPGVVAGTRLFMYRSCISRRDYRGGENHWLPIDRLVDVQDLARELRSGA